MSYISPEPHPWTVNPELQKLTVAEYLVERAHFFGQDATAVLSIDAITREKIFFKDFDRLTSNLASWFHGQGIKMGDVVLFMSRKTTKQTIFLTGVWRANGVASASYQQDLAETILERVQESSVKWIFCDESEVAKCKIVAAQCPWEVTLITNERAEGCVCLDDIIQNAGNAPQLQVGPEDPAIIVLTSGTTGKPKGALRTHKAMLCILLSSCSIGYLSPMLLAVSPIHLSGVLLPLTAIPLGVTTVLVSNFDAVTIMESIQKYRAKSLLLLPPTFNDVLKHPTRSNYDLTSVELITTGGSLILPSFYQQLKTLAKHVNLLYGSTECYGFISFARVNEQGELIVEERKGRNEVGRILPGSAVQIRDKDTGKILGHNEIGEIVAKHPGDIKEYLNEPEKTAAAFTNDGFYRLGDLGSVDENGILSVYGRDKDVFKYQSNHISPEEIEEVVNEHPAVKECCVVGVLEKPDGDLVEFVPRAYIVPQSGVSDAMEQALGVSQHCNSKLPEYMHLRGGVYVVDTLPRGNSGKVSRLLVSQIHLH